MKKVDFIIIGVQKGGTTSALHHLNLHPNIFMPQNEIHFFDEKLKYNKGLNHYHTYFKNDINTIPPGVKIGEKTPSLSYNFNAIKRIKDYNKDIKLILMLREPISRIYSQWNMYQQLNMYTGTFRNFIDKYLSEDFTNIEWNGYYPFQRSLYIEHIKNILNYFPKEQLHIAISEDIKQNPQTHYDNMFEFIGVDKYSNLNIKSSIHSRKYNSPISKEDFLFLHKKIKSYNEELYNFLGYEVSIWESKYQKQLNN